MSINIFLVEEIIRLKWKKEDRIDSNWKAVLLVELLIQKKI